MVDVDGTVAETYTTNLLPGVQEFFHLVFYGTCPHSPQIALATNQGGVGLRRWMETAGFGEPDKYPTLEDIESRLAELSSLLAEGKKLNVYASFSYQSHQGQWSPIPKGMEQDLRWSYEWRKPGPGMLLQAMQEAGVKPEKTLFVGDSSDDRGAAIAAGINFLQAQDFFARDWSDCKQLLELT